MYIGILPLWTLPCTPKVIRTSFSCGSPADTERMAERKKCCGDETSELPNPINVLIGQNLDLSELVSLEFQKDNSKCLKLHTL